MKEFSELELEVIMDYCIDLAMQSPSTIYGPLVGAVIVSPNGEIIGKGYKTSLDRYFVQHAERNALEDAKYDLPSGSTLFTTLEPCVKVRYNQIFRSCSELIVEAGISMVVLGCDDNSPSMCGGKGKDYLRNHGVEVIYYGNLRKKIEKLLLNESCPRQIN